MKSKTIIFAIICTILLLMLPNVNAIEYKEIKEKVNYQYHIEIIKLGSNTLISYIINLIVVIIELIVFIVDLIENILAFLAYIVLLCGHRDPNDSLLYQFLYLLHLINMFIGQSLINILNLISFKLDNNTIRLSQKKI